MNHDNIRIIIGRVIGAANIRRKFSQVNYRLWTDSDESNLSLLLFSDSHRYAPRLLISLGKREIPREISKIIAVAPNGYSGFLNKLYKPPLNSPPSLLCHCCRTHHVVMVGGFPIPFNNLPTFAVHDFMCGSDDNSDWLPAHAVGVADETMPFNCVTGRLDDLVSDDKDVAWDFSPLDNAQAEQKAKEVSNYLAYVFGRIQAIDAAARTLVL